MCLTVRSTSKRTKGACACVRRRPRRYPCGRGVRWFLGGDRRGVAFGEAAVAEVGGEVGDAFLRRALWKAMPRWRERWRFWPRGEGGGEEEGVLRMEGRFGRQCFVCGGGRGFCIYR